MKPAGGGYGRERRVTVAVVRCAAAAGHQPPGELARGSNRSSLRTPRALFMAHMIC